MSSSNIPYQTTTHGKWILAGEHAVIRGHGALVFPLPDKTLTLSYTPADTATELLISTHMLGHEPDTTQTLLQQILEYGFAGKAHNVRRTSPVIITIIYMP